VVEGVDVNMLRVILNRFKSDSSLESSKSLREWKSAGRYP